MAPRSGSVETLHFNNGEYLELVTARAHCQNLARVRIAREDSHSRRDHASMRRHGSAEAFKRFGAIINIHAMLKLRAEKRVAETWITRAMPAVVVSAIAAARRVSN